MNNLVLKNLGEFRIMMDSKDLVKNKAIFEAIKRGINKGYKKVSIFYVRLLDDPLYAYKYNLLKEEWPVSLDHCSAIFAENQMFEECAEIRNLKLNLVPTDIECTKIEK